MGNRRLLAILTSVLLLSSATQTHARRGDAFIDGVRITRASRSEVRVGFQVEKPMDQRVVDALESGLPVRFSFWVRAERPREFGGYRLVSEVKLVRELEKDNLRDRYRVKLDRAQGSEEFHSLEEALARMSRVDDLLVPVGGDSPQEEASVLRIRARLQRFKLPFQLHYLLAFLSFLDVETEWRVVDIPPPRSGDAP